LLLLFTSVIAIAWLSYTKADKIFSALSLPKKPTTVITTPKTLLKIQAKATDAKIYAKKNKYNADFRFLID
jgi:hypothetical protein